MNCSDPKTISDRQMHCPCRTGNTYDNCCKPFHQGQLPNTALKLMRSRYSAYALCIPEYIIHTTHPDSPHFDHDKARWSQQITEFSLGTEFKDLEILYFQEKESFATVTFVAYLRQGEKDVTFTEKSSFEKVNGKWLYHGGKISEGRAPNLI